jgi:hypothetical protein
MIGDDVAIELLAQQEDIRVQEIPMVLLHDFVQLSADAFDFFQVGVHSQNLVSEKVFLLF